MALGAFGFLLLCAAVGLGWKNTRAACAAILGALLGLVIAGSDGSLASVSDALVDGIRSNLNTFINWIL